MEYNTQHSGMIISGHTPRTQDSNASYNFHHYLVYHTSRNGHFCSAYHNGLHDLRRGGGRVEDGMSFPMTGSIIRTAFERIAPHISNLDDIKTLVEELEKIDSLDSLISELEARMEDAEVTFRTDIRILINECRRIRI